MWIIGLNLVLNTIIFYTQKEIRVSKVNSILYFFNNCIEKYFSYQNTLKRKNFWNDYSEF